MSSRPSALRAVGGRGGPCRGRSEQLDCPSAGRSAAAAPRQDPSRRAGEARHGRLGSRPEPRRRGGHPGPRQQTHGRQPGLQGHQAQVVGLGHRQGCGRPEPVPGRHGLRVGQCYQPAHWECEALLLCGPVRAGQPQAAVWNGCGPDGGLLHPLLPLVEGKDVSGRGHKGRVLSPSLGHMLWSHRCESQSLPG